MYYLVEITANDITEIDVIKAKYNVYVSKCDLFYKDFGFCDSLTCLIEKFTSKAIAHRIWELSTKINYDLYLRRKRYNKKIKLMENEGCLYFLTLNFNDDTLLGTKFESRKTYVRKFLKNQKYTISYIANVDYGALNGREHYHAVVCVNRGCNKPFDLSLWDSYGFAFYKRVTYTTRAVACYTAKLALHAFKLNNKIRIIYGRNKRL